MTAGPRGARRQERSGHPVCVASAWYSVCGAPQTQSRTCWMKISNMCGRLTNCGDTRRSDHAACGPSPGLGGVYYDPYQMTSVAQRLATAGLPMRLRKAAGNAARS